jgi:hypothetical protein
MPANPHRSSSFVDRLLADVTGSAVVDLLIRAFVDAERERQPAAGFEAAAEHAVALKR